MMSQGEEAFNESGLSEASEQLSSSTVVLNQGFILF
jgi:hypothetical protein